ncbi:hypothetical protein V1520DRAFT_347548 [Lipomyces starkeyi]|uniref:Uncharacterized protein n=1 Tax=Lipomyces starkeyi NRRL Y-11557 TaxID=675824 RepID=A0A1E3PUF1_LIPST|nr:hypothetical protein LIPSTDRAFT_114354 [Lipomyces starkeyi NRRL Y-11557]
MGDIGDFWRDVNAHRKEERANASQSRCWDWMIVSGDCHYARDRSCFKVYRPVSGTAGGARVVGIGTVELPVKSSPTGSGTHVLVLENVLHIPDAICNGFNAASTGGGVRWSRDGVQGFDSDSQPLWYAVMFAGLAKLVIEGNSQGYSVLEEKHLMLSIYLTTEEKANLFS